MERKYNGLEKELIPEKIKENLDLIMSAGGVLLGILIMYLFYIYGIQRQHLAVTIVIASASYLLLRKRLIKTSDKIDLKANTKLILLNNIIFFIALSLSVWLLWSNLYMRPLSYFILVSIASASVALEILYANKKKWIGIILFKILLIGITLGGGIYFEYDGIQGGDASAHNSQIEIYIEKEHIVEDNSAYRKANEYYYFPIHYLLSAITSILTSLEVYNSIFVSTAFMEVFIVVFIFFMGQRIVNTKTGLFAALIFCISDFNIRWVSSPTPMVLGVVFCAIILYLLTAKTSNTVKNRMLIIFLWIILILTHTIAAFIMFMIFFVLFIGKNINKYLQNVKFKVPLYIMPNTVAVFCIMLFAYWMYSFRCPECISFFGRSVNALYMGLTKDAWLGSTSAIGHVFTSNYFEITFNELGYLLVLFFGIIGIYMWMRIRDDGYKFSLALLVIILFAITYGFYVLELDIILSLRWFIFIYLILMIISAYGIFKLISLTNKKLIKVVSFVALIVFISFFMIHSTTSNNTPLFLKENVERLGYTTTELTGRETINHIFNGPIKATSPWYLLLQYNYYASRTNNSMWDRIDPDFFFSGEYNTSKEIGNLYVINRDAFNYPNIFKKLKGRSRIPFILNNTAKNKLNLNGNRIYDNGEVWGYVIKEYSPKN